MLQHPIIDGAPCPILQYADDTLIILCADAAAAHRLRLLLEQFGAATGLRINLQKSTPVPMHVDPQLLGGIQGVLHCRVEGFPQTYLGLPLSIGKPSKADLQAVVDKLAAKLPHWKARLLSKEGRLVYVQAVMSASVVYQLLALDLDPWFYKAVDKLRRSFLWVGSGDARGGSCTVAWHLVCQPKALGGLGLLNLKWMNVALRTRWAWLSRSDSSKPWHGLGVQIGSDSQALFNASVRIELGNGAAILFWEDPWIGGLSAAAIALALCKLVAPAARRRRTVAAGLLHNS
jgi:hypothetical protein